MTRRLIAIMGALILAGAGTAALVWYVQTAEERAMAGTEVVPVVVAAEPIASGTEASQLDGLVETREVPRNARTSGAIEELEEVDPDAVVDVDLEPGEQLLATRFVAQEELQAQEGYELPEGLQAVTVEVDPERGVGGEVRPGDLAGVIVSFTDADLDDPDAEEEEPAEEDDGDAGPSSGFALHGVEVLNVQGEATPPDDTVEGDTGQSRPSQPPSSLLVTLAVDAPQAEQLVFAREFGTIWLTGQDEDTSDEGRGVVQDPEGIYE